MAQNDSEKPTEVSSASKEEKLSSPAKKEVVSQALQHLAAGKRNLLVKDFAAATASFEEACRLLGEQYGETSNQCGEAYFYYGKSLLELARLEAGVIDNAFDGVNESDDEEEEMEEKSQVEDPKDVPPEEAEKVSLEVDDALIENCQESEKLMEKRLVKDKENQSPNKMEEDQNTAKTDETESEEKSEEDEESKEKEEESEEKEEESEEKEEESEEKESEEKKDSEKDKSPEEVKETESIGSNEAGTSEAKDETDKVAVDKEEEEDPSNLQLAWEMLELSKGIFKKHADSIEDAASSKRMDLESKLSETFQLLGEVSIENENYEQAVEDLNSCLRRRQEFLAADSRCIAETHYQLGVALGFNLQFDEAVSALERSISVLESRISNLESGSESKDPTKANDAFYTPEKEAEEIRNLIPEIKEKIADTRDMQEETLKKIKDQKEGFESAINGFAKEQEDGQSKPTSSITVKKRKKDCEEGSPLKKPHLETNGGTQDK